MRILPVVHVGLVLTTWLVCCDRDCTAQTTGDRETSAATTTPSTLFGQPIALFDGQTTNGWGKANGQPNSGWTVEDGALVRKQRGGDLYHESIWRDFELHFRWKISKGGNSGVKYRVRKYGKQWLGCEYQLLDDENAKERNKTATLYDVYETTANKPPVKHGVWQSSKIVVCGNRIEHWLNGVKVVHANVASDEWNQRVADSKFKGRDGFGQNRDGRIFLQDHGNEIAFRDIVIVPLHCGTGLAESFQSNQLPSQLPNEFSETSIFLYDDSFAGSQLLLNHPKAVPGRLVGEWQYGAGNCGCQLGGYPTGQPRVFQRHSGFSTRMRICSPSPRIQQIRPALFMRRR